VRDGLRMLAKDSVVRIQPHRGTHAVQLSSQDASDIFEIRLDLLGAMPHRSTCCDKAFVAIFDAELPELRGSFHNDTRPAAGLAFALT
jgi:DNA-binding GntR family transcriptional regulator